MRGHRTEPWVFVRMWFLSYWNKEVLLLSVRLKPVKYFTRKCNPVLQSLQYFGQQCQTLPGGIFFSLFLCGNHLNVDKGSLNTVVSTESGLKDVYVNNVYHQCTQHAVTEEKVPSLLQNVVYHNASGMCQLIITNTVVVAPAFW